MKKQITALGYDLSTTALSAAGRTADGEEVFASVPMRGATLWHNQPAFDLAELPGLFADALKAIAGLGFEFAPDGVISGSVRQHDMVLLDSRVRPLMPALSWQCNAAEKEVAELKTLGAEAVVGRLEPRLILPKLFWALKQEPDLKQRLITVMTTGDFVAMQLTGQPTLCSSEALSNGLLIQETRAWAWKLIASATSNANYWFPPVHKSGQAIPRNSITDYRSADWNPVRALLPGWRVVAGLGDNHAGAVGSGLAGRDTMIISAGTSGTVTRAVKLGTTADPTVLQFEYYKDTLLLLMLADCASWYDRFVKKFAGEANYSELDSMASAVATRVYRLPYPASPNSPFKDWFCRLPLDAQAKTMQYSLAYYLAEKFKLLRAAVPEDADHSISKVVLTGGLTRSNYFCAALKAGMCYDDFRGKILVSSRQGPLANQAATLGALINALVGGGIFPNLEAAIMKLCPTREI